LGIKEDAIHLGESGTPPFGLMDGGLEVGVLKRVHSMAQSEEKICHIRYKGKGHIACILLNDCFRMGRHVIRELFASYFCLFCKLRLMI
jgi:hypothetical protein